MLSVQAKLVRLIVTVVVFGLLLAGTVAGTDDDFPFGPFSMYAWRHDPDTGVASDTVQAVLEDGRVVDVSFRDVGLRRAEVEGQLHRFIENPGLLKALAVAHERRRPDAPRFAAVRVVRRSDELRNGQPTGTVSEKVVAQWVP